MNCNDICLILFRVGFFLSWNVWCNSHSNMTFSRISNCLFFNFKRVSTTGGPYQENKKRISKNAKNPFWDKTGELKWTTKLLFFQQYYNLFSFSSPFGTENHAQLWTWVRWYFPAYTCKFLWSSLSRCGLAPLEYRQFV